MKTITAFPKGWGWEFEVSVIRHSGALVFMSWKKRYNWHFDSSVTTVYASYTGYLTQMPGK